MNANEMAIDFGRYLLRSDEFAGSDDGDRQMLARLIELAELGAKRWATLHPDLEAGVRAEWAQRHEPECPSSLPGGGCTCAVRR